MKPTNILLTLRKTQFPPMKRLLLAFMLFFGCATASVAQSSYENPIIPGFYPDPSICRVGEDYFLVNSSFHYFPAVPLWHSKDLVHWTQIGNVLDRDSQVNLSGAMRYSGIYAPTIRYDESDGTFYMVTTNITNGGNFFVTTKDPRHGWSEPVFLQQQGIDPSFYFERGTCYMLSNPDNCICLCTVDTKTGKQLTPSRPLWKGTGGRYPEAPHIFKKDGWYYLLISEGGTEYGHMVTIARSRDIYGPYESNPANPILTHRDMVTQSSPIQATGHADLVRSPNGSWWMVCLGIRPQDGQNHLLGRETFLAPVRWEKGAWPIVNETGTISLKMTARLPAWHPTAPETAEQRFFSAPLSPEWVYVRNPERENYQCRDGRLALHGTDATLDATRKSPTMVLRRQRKINCEVNASLELCDAVRGDEAGVCVFLDADKHYDIFLREDGQTRSVVLRYRLDHLTHIEKEAQVPSDAKIRLCVRCSNDSYSFLYSIEQDGPLVHMGTMGARYLSEEVQGGFTGCMFGLYCVSAARKAVAEFDSFAIK